jgi:hypothetical protein
MGPPYLDIAVVLRSDVFSLCRNHCDRVASRSEPLSLSCVVSTLSVDGAHVGEHHASGTQVCPSMLGWALIWQPFAMRRRSRSRGDCCGRYTAPGGSRNVGEGRRGKATRCGACGVLADDPRACAYMPMWTG